MAEPQESGLSGKTLLEKAGPDLKRSDFAKRMDMPAGKYFQPRQANNSGKRFYTA